VANTKRSEHSVPSAGEDSTKPTGHYKAFGKDGELIWEQKSFEVGVDHVPAGISMGMVAMTITGPKGKVLRSWSRG